MLKTLYALTRYLIVKDLALLLPGKRASIHSTVRMSTSFLLKDPI